ncbi:alpha-L-fucosidase [Ginsengibacter hankyongi]|uniref:Alpha-L-fucosidase n=1 Tax=Ginsengibacter hankyongi TaxID=2607284 RepID=A0A5J5IAH1_9BACT|nr:alpha-L-fucosidase [Ginsengibacter hankyongi]KAA9035631.1 alpha-L-fucosidase [Ginsengibacter hankyongi]
MNNNCGRRLFIKKSAAITAGAFLIPESSVLTGSDKNIPSRSANLPGYTDIKINVDWQRMMKDHDLLWKKLPGDMTEAPHFGNGIIGSMTWVENNCLRLQVFRSDVHDHNDYHYGWTAYSRPRYQIGYFSIQPKGIIIDCDLRQDIYNAELKGKINTSIGSLNIRHLTHRHDDVIFTEIEVSGKEELSGWEWHPFEAKTSRGGDADEKRYGQSYAPYKKYENPEHRVENHDDICVGVQDLSSGGNYATAWKEKKVKTNKKTLLVSIENSYPDKVSANRAISNIKRASKKTDNDIDKWIVNHRTWWHNYYRESFVSFPDSIGQTFYWNNIYRLACCTRPDAQYIDTAGLWNSGGPWPYSTHDFNTQTAHFPVYTANRLHLGEALVASLHRNYSNLVENVVPNEWQSDSALLPLATAFDLKGKRDGDGRYREMVGCLPWLLNNCWLHYRYTMDNDMLTIKLFPLLRRSINMYRHLLYIGDDGKLHLPPTFSPESGNFSDCNFDLALLRWGCKRLIEICGILKIDDPLITEWKNILKLLIDYSVDERGYMLGRDNTAPLEYRHMSHLMMIYPLYLENIDNNTDKGLIEKSVRNFKSSSMPKMAASQSSPAAAALGLADLALKRMNDILYTETEDEKLGKNGIYYLATPCIETSLSYNTCVQDMLLQSWGNKIRIFPALPDEWKDVAFHNFRTEGAFLISACRKNGITKFVKIKSLAGEPCKICPSIAGIPGISSQNRNELTELGKGFYAIDLRKGEEAILYPGNRMPDIIIEPQPLDKGKINYFGLK